MGGDFSARGQQDCAKGIYCLAGEYLLKKLSPIVLVVPQARIVQEEV